MTEAMKAARDTVIGNLREHGVGVVGTVAEDVVNGLRHLPVEQRMEAMGMVEVAANLPRGYRRWAEEGTT